MLQSYLFLCAACKRRPEQLVQLETTKTGQNRKAEAAPRTAKHRRALVQHE